MFRTTLSILLLSLSACGVGDDFVDVCVLGARYPCYGSDGCSGYQECLSGDPAVFSDCVCDPTNDADTDADAGSEADAERDSYLPEDVGVEVEDSAVEEDTRVETEIDTYDPCISMDCDDRDDCTVDTCDLGVCHHATAIDGTPCADGRYGRGVGVCFHGSCCDGCLSGDRCMEGFDLATCGAGGNFCESCADENVCTEDSCYLGRVCQNLPLNGTECPDGICSGGRCEPCGGLHEPCCPPDDSCGPWLRCRPSPGSRDWCVCGGLTEPCCDGTSCWEGTCDMYGRCS